MRISEEVYNRVVDNCGKFYLVLDGDSCASMYKRNNIRTSDIIVWNRLHSRFNDLWLETYANFGVVGGNPAATVTPASANNGVENTAAVRICNVDNCKRFYMAEGADSYASIVQKRNIRTLISYLGTDGTAAAPTSSLTRKGIGG